MNFETSNLGGILPDGMLAWRLEIWSDGIVNLLNQLTVVHGVSPVLGTVLSFKNGKKIISISLKCWRCYYRGGVQNIQHTRTEFSEFLRILVKKRTAIMTILPQPVAEEIIQQYPFSGCIVRFLAIG